MMISIESNLNNDFTFLNSLIRVLRPDLCEIFSLQSKKDEKKWFFWLINEGVNEYPSLLQNRDFLKLLNKKKKNSPLTVLQELILINRSDLQKVFLLKKDLAGFLQWFYSYGVKEHNLWRLLNDEQRDIVLSQPAPWTEKLKPIIKAEKQKKINNYPKKYGVNVIGYIFGQLGIGEDARMLGKSFLEAEIPFTMIDFPPGTDISQDDRSMQKYVSTKAKYSFNIFCMTALENGRYYAENGSSHFKGHYNIGYWPWELSKWPKEWKNLTRLVDEVWVSTKHTYDSIVKNSTVPVYIMPMAVELGPISEKKRQDFGLPKKTKLFCFSFDLNSSIHRKNPQACVDSFLKAFPKDSKEDVGLIVKVHPPKVKNKNWEKLKKLASKDKRIYIIEKTLSREDLLALYSCCDCFLSLHKAEGFGRGIAEAMQLGLHVITTGYSGNVDFCKGENVDLVNYKLKKVKKGQYPFGDNQVWADADVKHAASLMKKFVSRKKKNNGIIDYKNFSIKHVASNYKKRLVEICKLSNRLCFIKP